MAENTGTDTQEKKIADAEATTMESQRDLNGENPVPEVDSRAAGDTTKETTQPKKRGRGRPKGSKNKPKDGEAEATQNGQETENKPKRRRGRPKGSKNKPKSDDATANASETKKRGPGRPKGTKNKSTTGNVTFSTAFKKEMKNRKQHGKAKYLKWYETMLRIRRFEERALMMYGQQKIRGFCHVYIGQEAITAGMESALQEGDAIVTAYRQHGTAIGRGISTDKAMAELYGKANGINKGKGGSMHFFSKEHRYFGGNGIVGAQIPIGTGIAFAEQYKGTDNICVTMFGDGAARQGALHESFNMAMSWKLPVLYVLENNGYAMGTSVERTSNVPEMYKIGLSYDMPSEQVDGMDVSAVYDAIRRNAREIRKGGGPRFLEIKTYRYKGHSVSDPAKYRSKDELNSYRDRDPIKAVEQEMLYFGVTDQEGIDKIKDKIKKEIEAAVEYAENGDFPDASELYTDNYQQEDYRFLMH